MAYTTYLPEEIFSGQISLVHVLIALIIIVAVVVFFSYVFYKILGNRKKPESF